MSDQVPVIVTPSADPAKTVSRLGMAAACIWIAALSLLRGFWPLIGGASRAEFGLSVNEIITTGVALVAVFSPIFLSIVLDKVVDAVRGRKL